MKKIICVMLCISILLNLCVTNITVYAEEQPGYSYGVIKVEFSDTTKIEDLDVMVFNGNLYADAKQLGERLGYQVGIGEDRVVIANTEKCEIPRGMTAFYFGTDKVSHMLLTKLVDTYKAPFEPIKDGEVAWIPLEYSLLLLNRQ